MKEVETGQSGNKAGGYQGRFPMSMGKFEECKRSGASVTIVQDVEEIIIKEKIVQKTSNH